MSQHFVPVEGSSAVNSPVESVLRQAVRSAFAQPEPAKPTSQTAQALARLEVIGAELNLLFAYRIEAGGCFAQVCPDGRPVLHLGRSIGLDLTLEIEAECEHFVLIEEGGAFPSVMITASEARIVDQIVSIVGSVYDALTPRTVDDAVGVLVGQSLADVECRLLLRTMCYFKGSGPDVAFALGIEEAELTPLLNKHLSPSKTTSLQRRRQQ